MSDRDMAYYDFLVEYGIATEDEISLVRDIVSGFWTEILDDILYARTGYRSWEQYIDSEIPEDYDIYEEWLED